MSSLFISDYFLSKKNKLNSMLFIFFFSFSANGTVHSAENSSVLNNFLATAQPVPDHECNFLRFITLIANTIELYLHSGSAINDYEIIIIIVM